jgi:hypothetical protein
VAILDSSPTSQALAELELVGITEAAAMIGCTRQNVSKMAQAAEAGNSRSGFPAPTIRLSYGALWARSEIERFLERRRSRAAHEG